MEAVRRDAYLEDRPLIPLGSLVGHPDVVLGEDEVHRGVDDERIGVVERPVRVTAVEVHEPDLLEPDAQRQRQDAHPRLQAVKICRDAGRGRSERFPLELEAEFGQLSDEPLDVLARASHGLARHSGRRVPPLVV